MTNLYLCQQSRIAWAGIGDNCRVTGGHVDDGNRDQLTRIVTTARRLFAEMGVSKTRLEDVASAAGMSRQYLYRFVKGREELIELALLARCAEVGAELEARAHLDGDDVEKAITDHIIAGISMGRDDREFKYLSAAMDLERLNAFLTNEDSPLHKINTRAFGPLLARAITAGLLRTDVSVDAMTGWLQGVMTMLSGRNDLDQDALRQTVQNFVLPSLFAPSAAAGYSTRPLR